MSSYKIHSDELRKRIKTMLRNPLLTKVPEHSQNSCYNMIINKCNLTDADDYETIISSGGVLLNDVYEFMVDWYSVKKHKTKETVTYSDMYATGCMLLGFVGMEDMIDGIRKGMTVRFIPFNKIMHWRVEVDNIKIDKIVKWDPSIKNSKYDKLLEAVTNDGITVAKTGYVEQYEFIEQQLQSQDIQDMFYDALGWQVRESAKASAYMAKIYRSDYSVNHYEYGGKRYCWDTEQEILIEFTRSYEFLRIIRKSGNWKTVKIKRY